MGHICINISEKLTRQKNSSKLSKVTADIMKAISSSSLHPVVSAFYF